MKDLIKAGEVNGQVVIQGTTANLTRGQIALLALMKKKVEEGGVISQDDVTDIYKTHVGKPGYWLRTDTEGWSQYLDHEPTIKEGWKYYPHSDWHFENRSKQWLRQNLGSLILKQKLVVIPIIEIE